MARSPRLFLPGAAQHIIQRGNNRQACFCSDDDYAAYAHWLQEAALENGVSIHAWVFMPNHVHLLVTPLEAHSTSLMMQQLGRVYVRYFNRQYERSGTLWEGRYKSCLVQDGAYLLNCYRYIELNPVRAGMVGDPADYKWSSYQANGLGKSVAMRTPHAEYLALEENDEARFASYRGLFNRPDDEEQLNDMRRAVNRGLVLGDENFKEEVASILKCNTHVRSVGRPRKN